MHQSVGAQNSSSLALTTCAWASSQSVQTFGLKAPFATQMLLNSILEENLIFQNITQLNASEVCVCNNVDIFNGSNSV